MVFYNFKKFGKIGQKIAIIAAKNGVFYDFSDPIDHTPTLREIWNQSLENGLIGLKMGKNAPWDTQKLFVYQIFYICLFFIFIGP